MSIESHLVLNPLTAPLVIRLKPQLFHLASRHSLDQLTVLLLLDSKTGTLVPHLHTTIITHSMRQRLQPHGASMSQREAEPSPDGDSFLGLSANSHHRRER